METISAVYHDGQFWVASIERIDDSGYIEIAKHTFGAEPTANDLLDFYLYTYSSLRFYASAERVRIKKRRSVRETERISKRSRDILKEIQSIRLMELKAEGKRKAESDESERFRLRRMKKKERKKGH